MEAVQHHASLLFKLKMYQTGTFLWVALKVDEPRS
jgi:hypothetical protein